MAALRAAPLARRKALLVAMLVDAYLDRLFAAGDLGDDILMFRATVAQNCAGLGPVIALCSGHDKTRLVTAAVAVPLEEYGQLGVADFMVSLYNDHSVQRLLLETGTGERLDMLATLDAAISELDRIAAMASQD